MVAHRRPLGKATAQSWQDRAIELAARRRQEHGGILWRTISIDFTGADGGIRAVEYKVESLSDPDGWHYARYVVADDMAICDCQRALYKLPCAHAGVAITYGRSVVHAWAEQAAHDQFATAARLDEAARGNSQALGY